MTDWVYGVGDVQIITVSTKENRLPPEGTLLRLEKITSDRVQVRTEDGSFRGEVVDGSARRRLSFALEKERPYFAEVGNLRPKTNQLSVRVSWPVKELRLPGPLVVVVSGKCRKKIRRWQSDGQNSTSASREGPNDTSPREAPSSWKQAQEWLDDTFRFRGKYLVFSERAATERNDARDSGESDGLASQSVRLSLMSPIFDLQCELRDEKVLWVEDIVKRKSRRDRDFEQAGLLLPATIEWAESSSAIPSVMEGALGILHAIQSSSPYLEIWQEYRKREGELIKERAGSLPAIPYKRIRYFDDVVRFFALKRDDVAPWADSGAVGSIELVYDLAAESTSRAAFQPRATIFLGSVRGIGQDYIDVDRPDESEGIPHTGILRTSARGDEIRLSRQEEALRRLRDDRTTIAHLGQLLSDGSEDAISARTVPAFLDPRDPRMADGRPPNERQAQAVEIALNTPDISVIQGPPGTGKTTVIRTILRRLKERGARNVVVTSHQHSAVDNVLNGLSACGVLGHRLGGIESSDSANNHEQKVWIDAVSRRVDEQLALIDESSDSERQQRALRTLLEPSKAIRSGLTAYHAIVQKVTQEFSDILPLELIAEADYLATILHTQLSRPQPSGAQARSLHQLRVLAAALPPDGPAGSEQLDELDRIVKELVKNGRVDGQPGSAVRKQIRRILEARREIGFGVDVDGANKRIEGAYRSLLELLAPLLMKSEGHGDHGGGPGVEAEALLLTARFVQWHSDVLAYLAKMARRGDSGKSDALRRWRDGLMNRPQRVQELFRKHADVWAVTCQQTVARRIGLYDEEFDYVIVDEAARTSPLDIIIPLVRAQKIILVGDQAQLPHVLDHALEKEFENAASTPDELKYIKESLFARLYDRLHESKRVRLNRQYRMHPQISRLVSDLFYPEDPLEDDISTHALCNSTSLFEGRSLVWVDIAPKGSHQAFEEGRYYNQREAEYIESCVRELLAGSRSGAQLSLGVITYYAQQHDLIRRRLTDAGREVTVGSVDAFQGEERDVIFLSMVRSNPEGRIGFLNSRHRLNVSLSRARRLLVIVGDSRTVTRNHYLRQAYDYCKRLGSIVSKVSPHRAHRR